MSSLLGPYGRVALIALALTLGACGDATKGDEDAINSLLRKAATSKDPRLCAGGSDSLIAQTSFGSSYVARDNARFCRENIARLAPDSIEVSSVDVSGVTAEATFKTSGGGLVFDAATIELRKVGGRWRTRRFKSIRLDRAAFENMTVKQATSGVGAVSREDAECSVRALRSSSDAEIERGLVAADPGFLVESLLRCTIEPTLRNRGLPRARIMCVMQRLRRRTATRVVQIFLGEGAAARARSYLLVTRVARECQ